MKCWWKAQKHRKCILEYMLQEGVCCRLQCGTGGRINQSTTRKSEGGTVVGLMLVDAVHGNVIGALAEHADRWEARDLVLLAQPLRLGAIHLSNMPWQCCDGRSS